MNLSWLYSRIRGVPAGKLLGNSTGSAAAAEPITIGTGLTLADGELSATGGGGGAVSSVNGETGDVVLTAADVGADSAGAAFDAVDAHSIATDPHGDRAYALAAAAAAQSAAIAASQPLDSDLTAIAALSTTSFGRGLLTSADAAGLRTAAGAAATTHTHAQSDVTDLTTDLAAKAPLVSPALTGTPTAPTAANGTNTTQIATTEFVLANGGAPADGSITLAKLANLATQRVIGRNSGSTGVPEAVTLSQLLDWIGSAAQGDILYRGSSGWARLAAASHAGYSLESGGAGADPSWVMQGPHEALYRGSSGSIASSHDRRNVAEGGIAVTSARIYIVLIQLSRGMVCTGASFWSTATAAGSPTNQWFALFDSSKNLLAITGDDTTTAWGAHTKKSLNFATPYTVPTSGQYYLGFMVKATNTPTIAGPNTMGILNIRNTLPYPAAAADTGLSNPASCPSTLGALTAFTHQPYGEIY